MDYGINYEMRQRGVNAQAYLARQDRERGKALKAQRRFIIVNAVVALAVLRAQRRIVAAYFAAAIAVCVAGMAVVGAFYPSADYHHGEYLASVYGGR